jgi:hypothetical protein
VLIVSWVEENKQEQQQMRGFFASLRMTTVIFDSGTMTTVIFFCSGTMTALIFAAITSNVR